MRKPRKKKELKGYMISGTLFVGDPAYMAGDTAKLPEPIQPDPANPFLDWNTFSSEHPADANLDLPGSFNGDLPGRGVVIKTNMLSGSYTVKKRVCKETGKILSVTVKFKS